MEKETKEDLVKDWGKLVKENEKLRKEALDNLMTINTLTHEITTLLETIKIINKHQGK